MFPFGGSPYYHHSSRHHRHGSPGFGYGHHGRSGLIFGGPGLSGSYGGYGGGLFGNPYMGRRYGYGYGHNYYGSRYGPQINPGFATAFSLVSALGAASAVRHTQQPHVVVTPSYNEDYYESRPRRSKRSFFRRSLFGDDTSDTEDYRRSRSAEPSQTKSRRAKSVEPIRHGQESSYRPNQSSSSRAQNSSSSQNQDNLHDQERPSSKVILESFSTEIDRCSHLVAKIRDVGLDTRSKIEILKVTKTQVDQLYRDLKNLPDINDEESINKQNKLMSTALETSQMAESIMTELRDAPPSYSR